MLELRNVKKIYTTKAGDTSALNGINIQFPDKGMVFITGKSGSGKTTLLNTIGGLDGITDGDILIDGRSFKSFTQKEYDSYRNTYVGFIFQEYNLLQDFTIEKNVKIANELQGMVTDEKKLGEILETVGLESLTGRNPSELSGGQKQRVAIARALIKNPKVIMADEPTGALDSVTGIQVMNTLKKLSSKKLVLVVSHDLELAEKYADRIITIKDGNIVSDMSIENIEIEGNVHNGDKDVSVKGGVDLNDEEINVLLKAIKEKKKVNVTETIKVREKKPTKVENIVLKSNSKLELINSKMKFSSSALLGLKSLKVKPIRLMFTIFLSVIAFAVFGIFDTVAAYSRKNLITSSITNSGYNSLELTAKYAYDENNDYDIRFSNEDIEYISNKTGYDFRGIYEINDIKSTYNKDSDYQTLQLSNKFLSLKEGSNYYDKGLNGIIEFKDSELENGGERIAKDTFDYRLVYGSYPRLMKNGEYQVAISKYYADSIVKYCGGYPFTYSNKVISSMDDLIGTSITITSSLNTPVFKVTGIIDCGEIPSKFDILKTSDDEKGLSALIDDFKTYINTAPYKSLFVAEGFVEYYMAREGTNRTIFYFSEESQTQIGEDYYPNESIGTYGLNEDNTLSFGKTLFDEDGNILLQDGEVLIDCRDVLKLYNSELKKLTSTERNAVTYISNRILSLKTVTYEKRKDALDRVLTYIKPVIEEGNVEKEITLVKTLTKREKTYEKTVKVVGVYFGINEDVTVGTTWKPFAFTNNDLSSLGMYANQGYYSRIIASLNSKGNEGKLADMMTATSGLTLTWFNNAVLKSVSESEKTVQQFFNLFLYISLVLAVFSIFMLFNYISTSIAQKRQTIGILRALGSGGKDIFTMFAVESLIISIIDGIFASILTGFGSIIVNKYIREIMNLSIDFAYFSYRQVLLIFAFSIVTAVISSVLPIIRISREKPVDLIRKS